MLVDSHCHLDYPALVKDREDVRERAKSAGVARMVNIGTTKKGFPEVRATAEACEEVFCTFGIHPHHVNEEAEYLSEDEIAALASNSPAAPRSSASAKPGSIIITTARHATCSRKVSAAISVPQ